MHVRQAHKIVQYNLIEIMVAHMQEQRFIGLRQSRTIKQHFKGLKGEFEASTSMMEAQGLLADVKGIEDTEKQLLDIVNVIERRILQALAWLLAMYILQDHACTYVPTQISLYVAGQC